MSYLFGIPPASDDVRKRAADRVPPGQYLTEKFPVLSYGSTPTVKKDQWRFAVTGAVERPVTLDFPQLLKLPRTYVTRDFHCVTGWSRLDIAWEGVKVRDILALAAPKEEATHVMAVCYGNYTTNLALETVLEEDVLIAFRHDGKDLEPDHGGPARLVVPSRYGYKSAKWIKGLDVLIGDQPGFWEKLGYHGNADPWKEERYGPPFLP
jgi:DMSO/TMAO reductase YedYZ molybdopterin-dependent catalytic subunit